MSSLSEASPVAAAVHLLRRGERNEVLTAALQLNALLEETSHSEAAVLYLVDMHRNSALQTLLGAFVRCQAWSEVELAVARAIAHLVAIEDEVEWQLLQQNAREILCALQILVTDQLSAQLVNAQVISARGSHKDLFPPTSSPPMRDIDKQREIVSRAVFKLCFVLSRFWSQSPTNAPSRPPSIGGSEISLDTSPSMSYRDLRRHRGISRQVTDIAQLLGMVASIISLLIGDESEVGDNATPNTPNVPPATNASTGLPSFIFSANERPRPTSSASSSSNNSGTNTIIRPEICLIDETTVLCASAMLSLSKVKAGKQSFVTHGSLALLSRWLKETRFILADAHNRGVVLPEDHLVFKLIASVCGILVAMVSTEGGSDGEQDYSIGWTDSNIIAMGIPQTIVRVICASIRYDKSFDSILESCVILFDFRSLHSFAETLLSLSSRSHNRPQLSEAKVPTALCVLLLSTLSAVTRDIHVTVANTQACVGVDRLAKKLSDEMHVQVSRESHSLVAGIAACCLNALSYYIDDEFSTASGTTPRPKSVPPPAIVELLCHPLVIFGLSYTLEPLHLVGRSPSSYEARLACLRVVSCLSEWAVAIEAMISSDIPTLLIRVCADDADACLSVTSMRTPHTSPGAIGSSKHGSSKHGSSKHGSSKHGGSSPVSVHSSPPAPPRAQSEEDAEVVVTACYSLANICQAGFEYAQKLFNSDLLSVMLDLTTSGSVEAERQAMRVICAMCQIIANSSYDNAVLDKVLSSLATAAKSPNALMQLEAFRGIAYLAAANDKVKTAVVDGPLHTIVSVLIDPDSDSAIRLAAESVLTNLGFVNGYKDLELCQFDFQLLKDWYGIKSWNVTQTLGTLLLSASIEELFVDTPSNSTSSLDLFTLRSKPSKIDGHPPKLQRSFTDGFKSLFFRPKDDSSLYDEDAALKDSIVSSLILKRSISSTSISLPSSHNLAQSISSMDLSTTDKKPPEEKSERGDRPRLGVIDLFSQLFPVRIIREHVIGLTAMGGRDKKGVLRMPKVQEVSSVLLPSGSYASFSKLGRIIERMIEDAPPRRWTVTFMESTFSKDFYVTLLDTVRRCPQISHLHFACSTPSEDARLGYLAGTLPSSVQFLSFSSALSPESIETLCVLLRKDNAAFSSSVEDSMFRPVVEEVLLGLLGLAITNQALDSKSVTEICSLLVAHDTHEIIEDIDDSNEDMFDDDDGPFLSIPSIPACRGLKFLDLSRNRLSDAICADIIRLACGSTLEHLDLSYNLIQKGVLVRDALEKHINNSQLRHLGLAHNELSKKVCAGFLEVARGNSTLTSLDFSCNDFKHSGKEYLSDALRIFLRDNCCLRRFDLSFNNFDAKAMRAIHLGLLQNETMLIILLAGNPLALKSNDYDLVLQTLAVNRVKYRAAVEAKVTSQNSSVDMELFESHHHHHTLSPLPPPLIPLSPHLPEEHAILESLMVDEESVPASLCVLFSAPLAWRDRSNKLFPIETLDHAAEREALIQVFREVRRDISLTFDFATTDSLRTALSLGCRALHFSGHGHPSCLIFEDGLSGLQNVSVDALKSLVRAGGLTLDFVFVSACHSRNTGEAFAEAGVPHVVCCKIDAKILDSAAMAFTRAFYLSLLSGRSVRTSFDIAREALRSSPYVVDSAFEGEKFILLPELGSHDVPLFSCAQLPRWPGIGHLSKERSNTNIDSAMLPSPPPDFEGREVDMYRVISTLKERRLVSVVGDAGQGKSAMIAAACRYVMDRNMFSEGVLFVRLAGVSSYRHFLLTLKTALTRGPRKISVAVGLTNMTSNGTTNGSASSITNDSMTDSIIGDDGSIDEVEEALVKSLSSPQGKLLLVLDHADELLATSDASADLKYFLMKLFDRCECVKALVSYCSSDKRMDSVGVVEHCITLGSLSLVSTLRLFARLAPCMPSAETKQSFVASLLPPKQANSTFTSKDLTPAASLIFELFGKGHPATIVKMACEADGDSVTQLQARGMQILSGKKPLRRSTIGSMSASKDQDEVLPLTAIIEEESRQSSSELGEGTTGRTMTQS